MSRPVIGVDPGKEGAAVVIHRGRVYGVRLLPSDDAGLSGRELVRDLLWLQGQAGGADVPVQAVVERAQSFPGQGIASAFRYGRDYGRILGVLDALGWPYETVPPAVWHKAIIGGKSDDPKARAREWVEANHPEVELRPGRRRKAHEGIVDAICIAVWGDR